RRGPHSRGGAGRALGERGAIPRCRRRGAAAVGARSDRAGGGGRHGSRLRDAVWPSARRCGRAAQPARSAQSRSGRARRGSSGAGRIVLMRRVLTVATHVVLGAALVVTAALLAGVVLVRSAPGRAWLKALVVRQ